MDEELSKEGMQSDKCELRVEGISCGACVEAIEGMLRDQKGIHSIKVALLAERAVVEYDPSQWDVEKIVGEISDIGFDATLIPPAKADVGPSPENLKTLFEFVFKGLDALGYEEHLDYDIAVAQGLGDDKENTTKSVVRVNVFRDHRQTVQYIQPQDAHVLGQAELVIIDEAAAIPLPVVRNLIGPYLVFLASTINGHEGTGRSLSLKLIQQLRESTRPSLSKDAPGHNNKEEATTASSSKKPVIKAPPKSRTLREIKLETPIRYSSGDKIEKWLNGLLCLDATILPRSNAQGCTHPSTCKLFYVSRDTLFSYHPTSEVFLWRMMALYVASHYNNQPNDLQLLFVLLPPIKDDENHLPEPLVVLQVALEGQISKARDTGYGILAGGDMIQWLITQQFQENGFAKLSGARVVRIACHPDYANMGYGSRALKALNSFYSGEYPNLDETPKSEVHYPNPSELDLTCRHKSLVFIDIRKASIEAEMPQANAAVASFAQPSCLEGGGGVAAVEGEGVASSMLEELDQAGDQVTSALRERQKEMLSSLDLAKYAIADTNVDWTAAEAQVANPGKSTTVSVKVNTTAGQKRKADDTFAHSSSAQEKEKENRRNMKQKY